MDKEIAAAIAILLVVVAAFIVSQFLLPSDFNGCMKDCSNSLTTNHAKCPEYCDTLTKKGITIIELLK